MCHIRDMGCDDDEGMNRRDGVLIVRFVGLKGY